MRLHRLPLAPVILFVGAALVAGAPQANAPQASPPQAAGKDAAKRPPEGVIRGHVVAFATQLPLRRARVSLTRGSGIPQVTSTDLEGRFEFNRLPAGRYTVSVSKVGFVTTAYGRRGPDEPSQPVVVDDGQVVEKIDVALPKAGVIAGVILDDVGEPAEYVRLAAMRFRRVNGQRQLVTVSTYVRTNDLGEYRIAGLPPGSYIVGTPAPVADSVPRPVGGRAFRASYWPGTSNLSEAQPIALEPGQERLNADFTLVVGRVVRVTGIVTSRTGRLPATSVLAMQWTSGSYGYTAGSARLQADGRFTFTGLASGDYTLIAEGTDPATGGHVSGWQRITVGDKDLQGLTLDLSPTLRVSGRFRFDGAGTPPGIPRDKITIHPEQSEPAIAMSARTAVSDDWSFEVQNVPRGPTRFAVYNLSAGWAVDSMSLDGRDLADGSLDIRANVAGLEILLTDRVTEVSGTVTDTDNHPAPESVVLIFAESASLWDRTQYLEAARPDDTGRYVVRGLPAGAYLAIALERIDADDAFEPQYLEKLRRGATSLTLTRGETKALNLRLGRK